MEVISNGLLRISLAALSAACLAAAPQVALGQAQTASPSDAFGAMRQASQDGKYLFVYFWKTDDQASRKMYGVLDAAMQQWSAQAASVSVRVGDPKEQQIVSKYGVDRAPMPLVLAFAPNGAITKGFPLKFTQQQLREAFVSPGTARCMKALQDQKLVLLCVQNEQSGQAREALEGAYAFQADKRFTAATEVVTIDPSDAREASFLTSLNVKPASTATTVLLAPPGRPVAQFSGAVNKDQIVAKVQAGPCAGGQCGPNGCCGPQK